MNPEAIKAAAQAWERGRSLQRAGRYAEAEPHFRAALKVMPQSASLYSEYGQLAEQLGDWKAAAQIWQVVGKLDNKRNVGDRVGLALLQQDRNAEALPWLESFAAAFPADADSAINLAACLSRLQRDDEAIAILQRAVSARPQQEQAWEALITLLINNARAAEAAAALDSALALFPAAAELRYLQMDHLLKSRDYAAGFARFDVRWETRFFDGVMTLPRDKRWDGQAFAGTLLVRAEQGVGDELLYSSLFADVAQRQADTVIECDPRLLPLFQRSLPSLRFIPRNLKSDDPARPAFTHDSMAGDLCRIFRHGPADFPARDGWLHADPEQVAAFRNAYRARFGSNLRVGISWRSKHPSFGGAKSLALPQLLPLLGIPGITFFNLQYGDTGTETAALQAEHGITLIDEPRVDNLLDLDGLAAQMCALDMVVSTSNSTVHLAGALGIPTRVLLHRDIGLPWYWAYDGEQVPWYPQTRLLRCRQRGQWDAVIAEVAAALRALPVAQATTPVDTVPR